MRAMVSTTATFFSLDSPNASRLKAAMRTVGSWFGPIDRVAWVLLETTGHDGETLGATPTLDDVSGFRLLDRKCSPSEVLETSRLEAKSGSGPGVRVGLGGSVRAFWEALDSAASFVCSFCQTSSVESWKAIAKPPRIPAMTT